jgi:hypothetical protein
MVFLRRFSTLLFSAFLCVCLWSVADESEVVMYRIVSTATATVSLPAGDVVSPRPLLRGPDGVWAPLEGALSGSVVSAVVPPTGAGTGGSLIVLHCPEDIDRSDVTPPSVVRFEVDGVDHGAVSSVSLGGCASPPGEVVIEVRDDLNAIRRSSIRISAGSDSFGVGSRGCEYREAGPRGCVLTLHPADFPGGAPSGSATIRVTVDDRALDDEQLTCTLSYRYIAPHVLADGRSFQVDSVTGSKGWREWWVIADGVKMDATGTTTAGCTWLSEETDGPHWLVIRFPEPVRVSGVRLWWAYYQTYRTSRIFDVQVASADGGWRTVSSVRGLDEAQFTEHRFEPVATRAIRIWQPAQGGHSGRAGYMWLSEVETLPAAE